MVSFKINSKAVTFTGDASTPLLWVIRDELKMTGTKFGCGIGECGACTVHINGAARQSCTIPVVAIDGQEITTIGIVHDCRDRRPGNYDNRRACTLRARTASRAKSMA